MLWPYVMLVTLPLLSQHITLASTKPGPDWFKRKTTASMKLFWVMLILLLIFRHESVGRDLPVYEYIFNLISENSWKYSLLRSPELLSNFLNKIIATSGLGFRGFIIVTSVISVYWLSKAYIKYSEDAALTIALFVTMSNFVLLFSGIKQSIAISLGLLAFEFVRRKKITSFLLVTMVAILFHTSAFMILFMYPLYYMKLRKKSLVFIVPVLAGVFVFNKPIFEVLGLILNRFTDYDASIVKTGSVTMLVLLIIFAIFSYIIPDESKMDADTIGLRNFLLFSVALQMFAPVHNLAMRMNYYYIIFIPLLIPKVIMQRSTRWNQVAVLGRYVMVIFFLIYFFMNAKSDNNLQVFPYHFFWEAV